MTQTINPVYLAAQQDYRHDLVALNMQALEALPRPAGVESLGNTLAGSILDAMPHTFVPYFIVMNSLNYQFWDLHPTQGFTRYSHNGAVGALAMQNSFRDAWVAAIGPDGASLPLRAQSDAIAQLAARIRAEGVQFIFGDIPQAASRRELLLEVMERTKLSAVSEYLANRVMNTGSLGWGDAQLLAYLFPKAYGDRYLKKAQLTLMFIAGQWNAMKPATPCALDVTAAADYQLPKVLRVLGLLDYAPELAAKVDQGQLIDADSREERAIRAATVLACRDLAEHFGCTIAELDFWLWQNRNAARDAQFHLTVTTDY